MARTRPSTSTTRSSSTSSDPWARSAAPRRAPSSSAPCCGQGSTSGRGPWRRRSRASQRDPAVLGARLRRLSTHSGAARAHGHRPRRPAPRGAGSGRAGARRVRRPAGSPGRSAPARGARPPSPVPPRRSRRRRWRPEDRGRGRWRRTTRRTRAGRRSAVHRRRSRTRHMSCCVEYVASTSASKTSPTTRRRSASTSIVTAPDTATCQRRQTRATAGRGAIAGQWACGSRVFVRRVTAGAIRIEWAPWGSNPQPAD